MSKADFYEEHLLDDALSDDTVDDYWMAVVYEDSPIAYAKVGEYEAGLIPFEQGAQDYDEFLATLDRHRDELKELGKLDSYNIVEETIEVRPATLLQFAGEEFEREIDREIMERFDERDREGETEEIGGDFDMLMEGMNPIVQEVVDGRTEEFKETMERAPLMQESKVFYGNSLTELFKAINEYQRKRFDQEL